MKLAAMLIAAVLLAPHAALAASFQGTGTVTTIRTHDNTSFPTTSDWFSIASFANAGTCGKLSGLVVIKIPDGARGDRMLSLLVAAKLANKNVLVSVDDTIKVGGYCVLQFMGLDP